jgi:endonuclease/exonuclease/phosphatase family metal-dependent hydrolase
MRKIILGLKIILSLILLAGVGVVGFMVRLSKTEYRPGDIEIVEIQNSGIGFPERNKPIDLITWNIGYASLDASQDFFMDGGKNIRPATDRNVGENVWGIQAFLRRTGEDIIFLQEVDVNSRRSYYADQASYFIDAWEGSSSFAHNFLCVFVPYPFPHFIGKVESGLLTLNRYSTDRAERLALPTSFTWPARMVQLKRCLLVERLPVLDSEYELVLVNLHLDAYDDGEGRAAQTRFLMDFLNREYAKGNYCVAGGDFNQTFPGGEEAYPLINTEFFAPGSLSPSLLEEGWSFAADTKTPSARLLNEPYGGNRDAAQLYLIDGFILSPNVEKVSVLTIDLDFQNSDHNPVQLIFTLK